MASIKEQKMTNWTSHCKPFTLKKIKGELTDTPGNVEKPDRRKINELRKLKIEIEQERNNYFQCHLLLSAIKIVAYKNKTESPAAKKIQQIITADDVANIACLDIAKSNQKIESLMVLGLEDYHKNGSNTVLSYSEKAKLKSAVEDKVFNICSRLFKCKETEGNRFLQEECKPKDLIPTEILTLMKSADSQFQGWYENLMAVRSLIKELINMRLTILQTIRNEKISWLETRSEYLERQAQTLELQILVSMFNENPSMPDAVKKLDEYSQKEYEETKLELEELKNAEAAYDKLKGTNYDIILNHYKQYKRDLHCKTWILNELS